MLSGEVWKGVILLGIIYIYNLIISHGMEKTVQGKKFWDEALRSLRVFLYLFFSFYEQNLRLRIVSLSLTSIVTLDKLL